MYYSFDSWNTELYHHGIKGQKWGERRFQNSDGSLTAAGKARYYDSQGNLTASGKKEYLKQYKKYKKLSDKADLKLQSANYSKYSERMKKGAGVATAAAAGYGYIAYNAVRASVYKHRMSDVGHSKAVAKAKAQAKKMQKMFGDVKMSDLTKKKK